MIYFLHIKNTQKIDCKLFFKNELSLKDYLIRKIPLTYAFNNDDKKIYGTDLLYFLMDRIEIILIDDEKVKKYKKLYKGDFYGE